MRTRQIFGMLFMLPLFLFAQEQDNLTFHGDFRSRIEQDWKSRKSDGTFRGDRTRLRYRARFGLKYKLEGYGTFGLQMRTGLSKKQQDPQLTFGDKSNGQGPLPLGWDKLYFQTEIWGISTWMGKNAFPFKTQNELFWSNNVNPEGVFFKKNFKLKDNIINALDLRFGYFVIENQNKTLGNNGIMQALQLNASLFNDRWKLFPSIYLLKNIGNIPDGSASALLNYSIAHFGTSFQLIPSKKMELQFDYYTNLEDYKNIDAIDEDLKEEQNGLVIGLSYGDAKKKGNFLVKLSYAYMEKYAAVDYLAQNDWARWDYGSYDSPDGRLTNFEGMELVLGYAIKEKMVVKMRLFQVNELVQQGEYRETGSRVRLGFDIGF